MDTIEAETALLAEVTEQLKTLDPAEIAEMETKVTQQQTHTGSMIAFFLAPTIAQRLAIGDGEPANDLHVTLVHLPDGEAPQVGHIVQQWAAGHSKFEGKINGIGRFTPDKNGNSAFHAHVDVPGLAHAQGELVKSLTDAGVRVSSEHSFSPHVTLSYLKKGEENPMTELPEEVPVAFTEVHTAHGDKRVSYPLGG